MPRYLNTDLDLISTEDITDLAAVLEASGTMALNLYLHDDGLWYATFETAETFDSPEPNIVALLNGIERLDEPEKQIWQSCKSRILDIGYEYEGGSERSPLRQDISSGTLSRIAEVGADLRFTLYAFQEEN